MSSVAARYGIDITAARRGVASRVAVAGRKYVIEAIGTFFLVFTVGATAYIGTPLAPLAVGSILMVMVYAGGHISGGHYNPAVTLAALVRRRIDLGDAIGYWVAQLVAGVVAALVVRVVIPAHATPRPLSGRALGAVFVVELLFTFALCFVVLNVATSRDNPNNSFYGLAVGFTLMVAAITIGGLSGAAINPAVTLAAVVLGIFAWSTIWVYLLAQVVAGVLAGFAFRALNPDDK
ncbi:MIP/aquaporin family protein [Planosporangium mesophilum]|uniref:MIP/aquaporin family protein n=1 Tax=Planosporangium mesophilum TaxID=689768 RepID=UPI0014392738|nr:aquaporin [Planosporangium mesophilum]NJC84496.1 porin [Planosporangium mesophilum]